MTPGEREGCLIIFFTMLATTGVLACIIYFTG